MKDENAQYHPFESGEQPASGKRNDIQEFKESVKQGTSFDQLVEDHSEIAMKYPSFVNRYFKQVQRKAVLESNCFAVT
eukprot:SAG11_NODE_6399_length_1321_cov_1.560556_1_plen_77_part_10